MELYIITNHLKIQLLALFFIVQCFLLHAEDDDKKKNEPPKVGNLSLPSSQQPSGLFSFVGNVIDKGEVQVYFFAEEFVGKETLIFNAVPYVTFGITDDFSISYNVPFAPVLREEKHRSNGIEDFFIQAGYAFYNKSTKEYVDQATLVTSLIFPTGSARKNPPTGLGAPSFFLGATYYRTWVDWFLFTSNGAFLTCSDHKTKYGEQFLYQFGFGRNICSPKGWIYAWMLEIDGQYSRRNRINGSSDHNSGGNVIYATPSLWISSKEFLLQFGFTLPLHQHLFGTQNKVDYALSLAVAWSFY